jgi:hypothetical protein
MKNTTLLDEMRKFYPVLVMTYKLMGIGETYYTNTKYDSFDKMIIKEHIDCFLDKYRKKDLDYIIKRSHGIIAICRAFRTFIPDITKEKVMEELYEEHFGKR